MTPKIDLQSLPNEDHTAVSIEGSPVAGNFELFLKRKHVRYIERADVYDSRVPGNSRTIEIHVPIKEAESLKQEFLDSQSAA